MSIRPIPTVYRGVRFASTLEADWAATFDFFGWKWQYEPEGLQLEDGQWYRPDFYLPAQRVWCEVKGPHNERISKPASLQSSLDYDAFDWESELVVVLRPPEPSGVGGEAAQWENTAAGQDIVIVLCPECGHHCFMDFEGIWSCRIHRREQPEPNKFWTDPNGGIWESGELPFARAPRDRPGPQQLGDIANEWRRK